MNNKKCPYCGFINFVDAEACRKCETNLSASEEASQSSYDEPRAYRGGVNSYNSRPPVKRGFTAAQAVFCIVGLVFGGIVYRVGKGVITGHSRVNWIEYRPEGASITVMMPNEPMREEPTVTPFVGGSVSIHSFTSAVEGQGVAAFAYADYSGVELDDASRALEGGLNGLLTKSKSTLVSKNLINYQGMPGMDFEVTPPQEAGVKNARAYGKLLLSDNRLYIAFITASENTDLLAGKDKFLNPTISARPAMIKIPKIAPFQPLPPVR